MTFFDLFLELYGTIGRKLHHVRKKNDLLTHIEENWEMVGYASVLEAGNSQCLLLFGCRGRTNRESVGPSRCHSIYQCRERYLVHHHDPPGGLFSTQF